MCRCGRKDCPDRLSLISEGCMTPVITECVDDVQAAAGLGEAPRLSAYWRHWVVVGDHAQDAWPWQQQADPDGSATRNLPGDRYRVTQRVSHQFRQNERDIVAPLRCAPPVQGGDGEFPGFPDGAGIRGESPCRNSREACPSCRASLLG